jgi:hypothetical protein
VVELVGLYRSVATELIDGLTTWRFVMSATKQTAAEAKPVGFEIRTQVQVGAIAPNQSQAGVSAVTPQR